MEKLTLKKKDKKSHWPYLIPYAFLVFRFLTPNSLERGSQALSGRVLLSSPERRELWQVLGTRGRGCSLGRVNLPLKQTTGLACQNCVNKHKFVCLMDTQVGQTSLNVRVWGRETIITGPSKNRWLV